MPLYDNDGTASYEIGYIQDNDGTTGHQIGYIQDNDGTAAHLIYTAELVLVKNTTLQSGVTFTHLKSGASTHTKNGLVVRVVANGGSRGFVEYYFDSDDIRGYASLTYSVGLYGWVSQVGYFPFALLAGTKTQLSGVSFSAYYSLGLNGATALKTNWGYGSGNVTQNHTISGTVAIPESLQNASEPIYLAALVGAYNNDAQQMTIKEIVLT